MTTTEAEYIAAWQALQMVDHPAVRRFLEAHAARRRDTQASKPVIGTGGRTLRSGALWPFGAKKGTPIEECETKDLTWLRGVIAESVDDPDNAHWRARNVKLLAAIDAELETR